jgi:hypothetical protein
VGELKNRDGGGGFQHLAQAAVDGRNDRAEGDAGDLRVCEEEGGEAVGEALLRVINKRGRDLALIGDGVVLMNDAEVRVGVANVDAEGGHGDELSGSVSPE